MKRWKLVGSWYTLSAFTCVLKMVSADYQMGIDFKTEIFMGWNTFKNAFENKVQKGEADEWTAACIPCFKFNKKLKYVIKKFYILLRINAYYL